VRSSGCNRVPSFEHPGPTTAELAGINMRLDYSVIYGVGWRAEADCAYIFVLVILTPIVVASSDVLSFSLQD
jgi:hypothetical protein